MQTTNNILLVRPANFGFNEETRASNAFQKELNENVDTIKQKVTIEFEGFTSTLKNHGVNVFVFNDTPEPVKTDAVFPNNWISFHADGTVVLYPMLSANRRLERRTDIIESLKQKFEITKIIDLAIYENQNRFLEGTGSIVFDRDNKIAYAAISPRTDKELFLTLCEQINYKPVTFTAKDRNDLEIYHTNVMMCVSDQFAIVCLDSIANETERRSVSESLYSTGHSIIDITLAQMSSFAGNMLVVKNDLLVMSQSAFDSLTTVQKFTLEKYCQLLPLAIPTIETIGGGSARCMIAEIFLPELKV